MLDELQPAEVGVENIFNAHNAQSALKLGHARGVVLLCAELKGLPISEYTPTQVKSAVVGYGQAEKAQVQEMVRRLLALPKAARADASDALAVAICHGRTRGTLETIGVRGVETGGPSRRTAPREDTSMIASLTGVMEPSTPGEVVVDVGGVGYRVCVPLTHVRAPARRGQGGAASGWSRSCARTRYGLFGFSTEAEEWLFQLLQDVTGVGPKLALKILSGMERRPPARRDFPAGDLALLSRPSPGSARSSPSGWWWSFGTRSGALEGFGLAGARPPPERRMRRPPTP